jgi:DUF971 family protein
MGRPVPRQASRPGCTIRSMDTHATGAATTPVRIHADRSAGSVEIEWADGHATTFGAVGLRWLCPCAYCRGEAGLPGWLDTAPTLTEEQTRLVDLHLIGSYAVAPAWADGHHTGYYPFVLLRDRCPCEICTAERGAPGDGSPAGSPGATRTSTEEVIA